MRFGLRADMAACLALRDARAAENARAREACLGNAPLCAALLADALRRGERAVDWPAYFRALDINYP